MSDKRIFKIERKNPAWPVVLERAVAAIREWAAAGDLQLTLQDVIRTLDQNAAMWPSLQDIALQVPWPHTVGGEWQIGLMPKESWKAVLTSAFERETQMAQAVGGGTVMVGASTSKYGKRKMGQFLEFVHAFGAERGVEWSLRARDTFGDFGVGQRAAA